MPNIVRRSARDGLPACFVLSPAAIDTLGFVTVGPDLVFRIDIRNVRPLMPATGIGTTRLGPSACVMHV
jgi:hypothetical protein